MTAELSRAGGERTDGPVEHPENADIAESGASMSTAGVTKYNRSSGVRGKDDRITPVKGMNFCDWHTNGVPSWAQGEAWFVRGCPTCKAKLDAGKVPADAPAPRELIRLRRYGRWTNRARREKQARARAQFMAAQPAPERA